MIKTSAFLSASLLALALAMPAHAADVLFSGAVKSASGEKMGGVAVAAKQEGSTITTTVYTDADGAYYFPPLPSGKYSVWANALGFEHVKGAVDLGSNVKGHEFTLKPITDYETRWKQLPGDEMLAALPESTPEEANLKTVIHNNCTGCHTPSYILQNRFDEEGWFKIIDLMKRVPGTGVYNEKNPVNAVIDYNHKALAAYLAKARGPGAELKIRERARPSGEAARAVWKEYDMPNNPDSMIGLWQQTGDGSDWTKGTPSKNVLMHDAFFDFDGNMWWTSNNPNKHVSLGRVDRKTGEVKFLKVMAQNGLASNSHGMARDSQGYIWFDINTGRRSLGRLDPKKQEIKVFATPSSMSPLGGAVTIDVDGKQKVWASSPDGALQFDPETEKFTEFKSLTYKTANGPGMTYGVAADRHGNGWWAQMPLDIIGKGNMETGKSEEFKLPEVQGVKARQTPEAMKAYEHNELGFNFPYPWQQGPRRMGTDKNSDTLWIGNSWGGSLTKIDVKTGDMQIVPMADPKHEQPYHIHVDSQHNAWGNLWNSDHIYKYDPALGRYTRFDLPRRGTEVRFVSLDESRGQLEVLVPIYRTGQMGIMTVRSEADMAAAKRAAQ
jgi:streptogramin lyase